MNTYLILKALHLIAVISWMAGLLYLPRIFVYHVENEKEENISNTFKVMERKLYYYIMTPAMILAWFLGLFLIASIGFFLGSCLKRFNMDKNTLSSKFYRIFNEVPTILLILIVFIVVFKPI